MKRHLRSLFGILALAAVGLFAYPAFTQVPDGPDFPFPGGMRRVDPRIVEYQNIAKSSKAHDGLFKLFQKGENVYAELQPRHMGKSILCPIAVARGEGMGGTTLNFEEQWVLVFKRVGDRVHLVRRSVHHKARGGSPTARAVEITYSDSVLMSLRIVGINQGNQGVLINLNDVFMTDFARLNRGYFDASRSTWHKVKAFPKNLELQVAATYAGSAGEDDVIDERSTTVVPRLSMTPMPPPPA